MTDFFKLVQRLNQIEDSTEATSVMENSPIETGSLKAETAATASLLQQFNAIQNEKSFVAEKVSEEEIEVEETMQDRFAKFLKAERTAGTEVEEMKSLIDEGTAEYEYADRAFSKIAETMNMLNSMVAEGGMLGRKINEAGGDATALEEVAQALNVAREALTRAHSDALGIALEEQPEE